MTKATAEAPRDDDLVLELARLVNDADLASKLERAYSMQTTVMALTFTDRDGIIAALRS